MSTINASQRARRGAAAVWAGNNPVLAAGELGYATDTGVFKCGDGTTAWNDLDGLQTGALSPASTDNTFAPGRHALASTGRTTILTNAQRGTAGLGEWLDGTAGRIEISGTTYLFSCELDGADNVIVRTTVTGTDITGGIVRTTMTGVPVGAEALGGKVYYDTASTTLLMLTHTNRVAVAPANTSHIWSAVGLAKSTDLGVTWSYLGDVVTVEIPINDANVGPNTIGSFPSYVIDGTYMVVVHADQRADGTPVPVTASRCLLSSVLSAAAANTAPTFTKWDGTAFIEAGLGGYPGHLFGTDGWKFSYPADHAEILSVPAIDGFILMTSGIGDVHPMHCSFARSPEGPWGGLFDPFRGEEFDPAGSHVYSTMFGSDGTRPWELQADGIVQSYEVVQPTAGDLTVFDVELVEYRPCVDTSRPMWFFDMAGTVADVTAAPGDVQPIWSTDPGDAYTAAEGDVALVVYDIASGLVPGLMLARDGAWVALPQPPVGEIAAPFGGGSLDGKWSAFRRHKETQWTPDSPPIVPLPGGGGGGSVATDAIFDAKGDLPVGTGANTSAKLTVGANDTMPVADSAETTGIKWATPSTVRTALGLVVGTNVQAWDADLDAVAALAPSNDDIVQRKAGAWTNRTMAQLAADLWLPVTARRTADATPVTASTTLADDSSLSVAIGASETHTIEAWIYYTSGNTADFKFAITGPSGATCQIAAVGPTTTDNTIPAVSRLLSTHQTLATDVLCGGFTGGFVRVTGTIYNSTNAGNVKIQWAQNTSDAANTYTLKGSTLTLRRVA